jgi:WD40 repeat protein
MAFALDGRVCAAVKADAIVALWESATGKCLGELPLRNVHAIAASGRILATGTLDGEIRLWDVETRSPCATFEQKYPDPTFLAFAPGGKLLASAHADGRVWLWDVAAKRQREEVLPRLEDRACGLTFTPDGATLASAARYRSVIQLWDVQNRRALSPLAVPSNNLVGLAYYPDGRTLAIAGSGQIFLFHVLTGQEMFALGRHQTCSPTVNFTPDGETLITGVAPAHQAGKDVYELITWHAPRAITGPTPGQTQYR